MGPRTHGPCAHGPRASTVLRSCRAAQCQDLSVQTGTMPCYAKPKHVMHNLDANTSCDIQAFGITSFGLARHQLALKGLGTANGG